MNIDNAFAAILAANMNQNIESSQEESIDECCKGLYTVFNKLCNAGFSPDQSLTLLLGIIGSVTND